MADTTLPAVGSIITGATAHDHDLPAGSVVALRVAGATYPHQQRRRQPDGRWFPPVNPAAEYEVTTIPARRGTATAEETERA